MQARCVLLCSFLLYSGMANAMEIVPFVQVVDGDTNSCGGLPTDDHCLALKFNFFMINRLSSLLPPELPEEDPDRLKSKMYLPYLHYVPAEIFAHYFASILLSSDKFRLYTGKEGLKEDKLEELQKKFENLNLAQDQKSQDSVIDIIPKSLSSNLKQLDNLIYKEKKLIAKNILKFVEYSSKPLASKCNLLIERHLLQAALVYILDHCSNDFRILSNQEKQNFLLPELVERFKEIFGFMSWNEKKKAVDCCCIYLAPELQLKNRGLSLSNIGCVSDDPSYICKFFLIFIGIGLPLYIAIAPITISGPSPFTIGVSAFFGIFIVLEFVLCSAGWVYNMQRVYDLDDALLELDTYINNV